MPLFEAGPRKERWRGSRALVAIEPGTCPVDGARLVEHQQHQPALIRGAGYGATLAVTTAECPECRFVIERSIQEVKPS